MEIHLKTLAIVCCTWTVLTSVGHAQVADGLSVRPRRQAGRTSDGGCRDAVFPNLVRHFVPGGLNQPYFVGGSFT